MADTYEGLIEGFERGVRNLPKEVLAELPPGAAFQLGLKAARAAVAPLIWTRAVGYCLETAEATQVLGISRQALSKRVANGSLLGFPRRGTTAFPAWQFNLAFDGGTIWPEVREILSIFVEEVGRLDPYAIAAWAATPSEDLGGLSPADWLAKGGRQEPLFQAARRTAGRLAS